MKTSPDNDAKAKDSTDIEKYAKWLPAWLLPPLGVIGLLYTINRGWVEQNWKLLLVLLVVYLVLLFIGTVLYNSFGFLAEVINQDFKPEWHKLIADRLRVMFARGYLKLYKRQMCIEHGIDDVRALGDLDAYTLDLKDVFVELKINTAQTFRGANTDMLQQKWLEGARPLWDFLREMPKGDDATPVALVLRGAPGCGKTTLLKHAAYTLAADQQGRYGFRAAVPILLFLRDHVATIERNKQITLGELTYQYIKDRFPKLDTPSAWFEQQLDQGRCVVMLDGLDEVAATDQRKVVSDWVDRQLGAYHRCYFVISSRPQGYESAPLEHAHILDVQPFNHEQVTRFVRQWYLATEIRSYGNKRDEGVEQRAERGANDLLQQLRKSSNLNALTVNPLLLRMVAMVHRHRAALPGSRVALYKEIFEVMLERWRRDKEVQDSYSADQKRAVLMPLAAQMMERRVREVSLNEAALVIAPTLERIGVLAKDANKFLSDLQASSGLIIEREATRWGFAHLTFQEYLTSAYWQTETHAPTDWASLVNDSWWHETLRLYAAQGDATSILQACLSANSIAAFTLAAEIMAEGTREIAKSVREAVKSYLFDAIESPFPALRQLAA